MSDGVAYGHPEPTFREELVRVGPGSPMGEVLRRYWHPVALSSDARERPERVRALGEDLILFRDGKGRPGLVYSRCIHRGASLFFGRTEERGIRCCYHGWLFDVEGHCLEQPCERGGGTRRSRLRQPWYPVEERYGLVFAYMGPPERKPVLPQFDILEDLQPGEILESDGTSIGSGGPVIVPCNWLQHFENVMDPFHVPVLHGSFSGNQFVPQMSLMPNVTFEYTDRGVRSIQLRTLESGGLQRRVTEAVLPTLRVVPNPSTEEYGRCSLIGWVLPMDDRSFRIYSAGRVKKPGTLGLIRSRFNGKSWWDLTPEEHQQYPGDYEAQVGQGPITFHSEETLVASDRGVTMLRRMLLRQIETVKKGGDPLGVAREPTPGWVKLEAGTFLTEES